MMREYTRRAVLQERVSFGCSKRRRYERHHAPLQQRKNREAISAPPQPPLTFEATTGKVSDRRDVQFSVW
jgi:hypothetical protein